jgi:methyl-accepting chemotaxis protein
MSKFNSTFTTRSIKSKLLGSFAAMAALVCVTGAVGAWFTFSISQRAEIIGEHLGPINEAALEIKLHGTKAHLYFEEIIAGDQTESIEQVWAELDRSLWFANAVIKGDADNRRIIQATNSDIVREKMQAIVGTLEVFKDVARERISLREHAQTATGQQSAGLRNAYEEILKLTDGFEQAPASSVLTDIEAMHTSIDAIKSSIADAYILTLEQSRSTPEVRLQEALAFTEKANKILSDWQLGFNTTGKSQLADALSIFETAVKHSLDSTVDQGNAGSAIETRFDDIYDQFVKLSSEAGVQIETERANYITEANSYRHYAMYILLTVLAAALLLAVFLGQIIGRNISGRVIGLSELMKASAENKTSGVNNLVADQDEIGEMARSLEFFRSAIAEKEKVETAAKQERDDTERRNKELENSFQSDLSTIIDSASAGDFNKRVDTTSRTGLALKIADGMNRLVGTVDGAMRGIRDAISGLARGDLTQRVEGDYSGIFLELKNDTNTMAEKFRSITRRISSSTSEVQNATREIFSGVSDLSVRTEHQASSLEETAASMEEISATVRQNADNALELKSVAEAARSVAENGNNIVNSAVASMTEIDTSSQQISEIVGLIQDIAFQTNILALNAAVEAARAGEAGKGFAVVANEVRTLAQRAGQASKDIRILIRTSEARVKDGVTHVQAAGASLAEILGSVHKVADLVSNIASATQEQSSGIDQVSKAVSGMDQMTQQNAALVEETNAALRSTQGQLEELRKAVDFFKFEAADAVSANQAGVSQPEPTLPVREQFHALAKRVSTFRHQPHQASAAYKLDDWKEF